MPKPSRLRLAPLPAALGREDFGDRLARIRKEKGISQVELARKVGLIQTLVSDYERGKLRLRADMIVRFAVALGVSADELLGLKSTKPAQDLPRLRLLRRAEQLQALTPNNRRVLLTMLEALLAKQGQ